MSLTKVQDIMIGGSIIEIDDTDSPYTVTISNKMILVDSSAGAVTVTLPVGGAITGKRYVIKKTSSDFTAVTITANGVATIDGEVSTTINTQYECLEVEFDGTVYHVIRRDIPSVWTAYTPTITGMGSATEVDFFWKRIGDSMHVRGSFKAGTASATQVTVTLANSAVVDSAKIGTTRSTKILGHVVGNVSTTVSTIYASVHFIVTYDSTYLVNGVTIADTTDSDVLVAGSIFRPDNGSTIHGAANRHMTMVFDIPISGWKG